jgi:uncharacterized phage protein (TIGR02218 family)
VATQVELYRFTEQDSSEVWTYTSADVLITYNSEEYEPISISRSGTEIKNDLAKADLTITLPLDNEMGLRWMKDNGELLVGMVIFTRNKAGVINVTWKGRLASTIPGMDSIQLKFESIFTSMRRPGLRARYQKSCRYALYGRGCGLNPDSFDSTSSVTGVIGRTLTCEEALLQPNGYFTGGMLRSPEGVLSYIVDHVGKNITVQRLSNSLQNAITAGLPFSVTLYPGCDHSRDTCWDKFSNGLNYGGFDFIPSKNPTGGSSIV